MVCDILLCTMIFLQLQFLFTIFLFSKSILHARIFETWEDFSALKALAVITYMQRMFLRHGNVFQKLKMRQHNFKLISENSYIPEA